MATEQHNMEASNTWGYLPIEHGGLRFFDDRRCPARPTRCDRTSCGVRTTPAVTFLETCFEKALVSGARNGYKKDHNDGRMAKRRCSRFASEAAICSQNTRVNMVLGPWDLWFAQIPSFGTGSGSARCRKPFWKGCAVEHETVENHNLMPFPTLCPESVG